MSATLTMLVALSGRYTVTAGCEIAGELEQWGGIAVLMVIAWEKDDMREVTLRVIRPSTVVQPMRRNPVPRPAP